MNEPMIERRGALAVLVLSGALVAGTFTARVAADEPSWWQKAIAGVVRVIPLLPWTVPPPPEAPPLPPIKNPWDIGIEWPPEPPFQDPFVEGNGDDRHGAPPVREGEGR